MMINERIDKMKERNPFISNTCLLYTSGCNREYFSKHYPGLNIRYGVDREAGLQLADHQYLVLKQKDR